MMSSAVEGADGSATAAASSSPVSKASLEKRMESPSNSLVNRFSLARKHPLDDGGAARKFGGDRSDQWILNRWIMSGIGDIIEISSSNVAPKTKTRAAGPGGWPRFSCIC